MSAAPAPRLVTKPSSTANTKPNRLPAPTLFVGPPSLNASQISIVRNPTGSNAATSSAANDKSGTLGEPNNNLLKPGFARTPLERTRSGLSYRTPHSPQHATSETTSLFAAPPQDYSAASSTLAQDTTRPGPSLKKPSARSLDAKWREMQVALNEVELTAQSSTQVFGARHAAALDDLRRAQIELAHAWVAGSETQTSMNPADAGAGDGGDDGKGKETGKGKEIGNQNGNAGKSGSGNANGKDAGISKEIGQKDFSRSHEPKIADDKRRARATTDASLASTAVSEDSVLTDESAGTEPGRGRGEDETAQDLRLASERRAVNEAYFRQVDSGVKDVVAKLQAVAAAVKGVESESRSLWSRSSSEQMSARNDTGETPSKPS